LQRTRKIRALAAGGRLVRLTALTVRVALRARSASRVRVASYERTSVGSLETTSEVIVRVLRARIRPGRVGAFNAIFRQQVPLLKEQPGLVYVKLARRLQADGGEDVVLFEEWEDAASLYAWVGPNLLEPRLVPGARDLIDDLVVAHYEALDKDNHVHEPAPAFESTPGEPFEAGGAAPPDEGARPPGQGTRPPGEGPGPPGQN
jgi:Antibiotic biosynthesis monooxygenase